MSEENGHYYYQSAKLILDYIISLASNPSPNPTPNPNPTRPGTESESER